MALARALVYLHSLFSTIYQYNLKGLTIQSYKWWNQIIQQCMS